MRLRDPITDGEDHVTNRLLLHSQQEHQPRNDRF